MENVICSQCHRTNTGTTTLYHCQYCGYSLSGVPRSATQSATSAPSFQEGYPVGRRKPWLAGFLSLFVPGLGQVYNGQALKGVLLYCLYGMVVLASMMILLKLSLAPFNIAVPLGVILAGYLYILVDAVKTARSKRDTFQPKFYNKWYVYLAIVVLAAFVIQPAVGSTIRNAWVQAFKIPAESMKNTLLVGDHLLVNKFFYHQTSPKRFDIIVFHYPWEDGGNFIKRVIGLPGDRVQVHARQVVVNDQPLQEPYTRYTASAWQENFGPVMVPKKGDRIEIRNDKRLYLNGTPVPIPSNPYHPSGLFQPRNDGVPLTGLEVFYGAMLPPNTTLQHTLEPRVVEHDYYFVLGDNRDNSQDSRYWGFVPRASILGAAQRIYWSWDRSVRGVRWERIGQEIR